MRFKVGRLYAIRFIDHASFRRVVATVDEDGPLVLEIRGHFVGRKADKSGKRVLVVASLSPTVYTESPNSDVMEVVEAAVVGVDELKRVRRFGA